ncbi:exodeoxyribonuclease VII small subunit [Prosthecochloris sp. ZM]|nr:exodeoxyribonuclease VII small subunit [Prosthecochloris sp.]RDD29387.1 exodeoxyribonuclease VII small subunit [Prosthecochloris sp. ZM]
MYEPSTAHLTPMSNKKQSIEELITRLEEITTQIDNPDTGVENSIKLYEEGLRIADLCKKRLQDSRQKLETINPESQSGKPSETPRYTDLFSDPG